jgi:hypothetical protein
MNGRGRGQGIQTRWNVFAHGATAIGAILAGFLLPPPIAGDGTRWVRFGTFAVAAFLGLLYVPMHRWNARSAAGGWLLIGAVFLCAGAGVLYGYEVVSHDQFTVPYANTRVVHGSRMRGDAMRYQDSVARAEHRVLGDSELLMDYAGQIDEVWDPSDRGGRERYVGLIYLGALLLLATAVVTIVQATNCVTRSSR